MKAKIIYQILFLLLIGCKRDSDSPILIDKLEPCLSIAFDGGYRQEYTDLLNLLLNKGVKATTYVEPSKLGTYDSNGDHLTINELLELQNAYGWEVGSHSMQHLSMAGLSNEQIEFELAESKNRLINFGFDVRNFAYPNGSFDEKVMAISQKYYNTAAMTLQEEAVNYAPISTYKLIRMSSNDGTTLDRYKTRIDEVKKGNGWVIIYAHAFQYNSETIKILSDIIDYAQSQQISILTVQKAFEKFQNKIDFGFRGRNKYIPTIPDDYDYRGAFYYVDFNGKELIKDIGLNEFGSNNLITDYKTNFFTIFKIDERNTNGFPNNEIGIVCNYKFGYPDIDRQEFYGLNSKQLYKRVPDSANLWGDWEYVKKINQ